MGSVNGLSVSETLVLSRWATFNFSLVFYLVSNDSNFNDGYHHVIVFERETPLDKCFLASFRLAVGFKTQAIGLDCDLLNTFARDLSLMMTQTT